MAHTTLPKFASKVPNITKLRKSINYGEDRKPLGPKFWKHLQVYREYYKTASGTEGSEFVKWKDPEHKAALITMIDEYLDYQGNGSLFWPDDSTAPEYNSLRYSIHHEFIKSILIQIVFRLNNQQYSNDRYKSKKASRSKSSDASSNREGSTLAATDTTPADKPGPSVETELPHYEPYFELNSSHDAAIPPELLDPSLTATGTGDTVEDPYQVPDSPQAGPPYVELSSRSGVLANDEVTSSAAKPSTQKKPRTKLVLKSRSTKRRAKDDAQGYRNPHRLRKRPRLLGMASEEEVAAACSPRPSTEGSDAVPQPTPPPPQENTPEAEAAQHQLTAICRLDHALAALQQPSEVSVGADQPLDTAVSETGHLRAEANRVAESSTFFSASRTASPTTAQPPGSQSNPAASNWARNEATRTSEQHAGASSMDAVSSQTPAPMADMGPSSEGQFQEHFLKLSTIPEDGALENSPSDDPLPTTEATESNTHRLQLDGEPAMGDTQLRAHSIRHSGYEPHENRNPRVAQEGGLEATDRLSRRCRTLPPDMMRDFKKPTHWPGPQSPPKPSPTDSEPPKQEAEKPNVSIRFVLVLARYPKWKGQEWTPEGRFSKKSLPQLMNELPAGFSRDTPGLIFRLSGPDFRTEEPVPHGENATFDAMQESFAWHIRKNVRDHKGNPVSFRMEIEALEEGYLLKAEDCTEDVDDGVF